MPTFFFHPPGLNVKIIMIDWSTNGRSRYAHHICCDCWLKICY